MSPTTRQKLSTDCGPYLAYFIDQSNEVTRWSPHPDSTDDDPMVTITVSLDLPAEYIRVDLTKATGDGA